VSGGGTGGCRRRGAGERGGVVAGEGWEGEGGVTVVGLTVREGAVGGAVEGL